MTQFAVSVAVILLVALVGGGIHGSAIKPLSINSALDGDGSGTDTKILLAKAGLSVGQCIAACEVSVTAMEAFCRLVPYPGVRAVCWSVAVYAGSTTSVAMCTGFCYNYFV